MCKGPVTRRDVRGFLARTGMTHDMFAEALGLDARTVSRMANSSKPLKNWVRLSMNALALGMKKAAR